MLPTINLNNNPIFKANEVQNEGSKWDLPAKLDPIKAAVAKQQP